MTTTFLPATADRAVSTGATVGHRRQLIRVGVAMATLLLGGFVAATALSRPGTTTAPPASVEIYAEMVRAADAPPAAAAVPAAPVRTSAPSSLDVLSAMNADADQG